MTVMMMVAEEEEEEEQEEEEEEEGDVYDTKTQCGTWFSPRLIICLSM